MNIAAADLFAGAGGTSTGLARACERLGAKLDLIAVNHWDIAVETHAKNHPNARHYCTNLDAVDPRKLVPGGRLDLLVASPECTHHSNARGGKPMSDQSRATAWCILRWAEALYIESILIENVREFESWGPLGADGRPLASKRGHTFQAFLNSLRSLGYRVEHRVLNAANYGDPTTRERLFIIARRGNRRIPWPEATHSANGRSHFDRHESRYVSAARKWRPAREIIDWAIPGTSIFGRKKPLADATIERIAAGLRKFGGTHAEPFLVILRNNGKPRSVDSPVPALCASGKHIGLVEPFMLGQQSGGSPRSVNDPSPTIATDGAISLVQPFITRFNGNHADRDDGTRRNRSVDEPLGTLDTSNRFGLVEPFILPHRIQDGSDSIERPLRTVTAQSSDFALVEPFMVSVNHGDEGPLSRERRAHSISDPMPTITNRNGYGMVEPFLVKYNGTADARPVHEPMDTVTAKDRFGLVTPDGLTVDILFRMLQPHELAAAQGFPAGYIFCGNREQQVRQIGNAVPVGTAEALVRGLLQ